MVARHMSEQAVDTISIQQGIIVGETSDGTLVWRDALSSENPNHLQLPYSELGESSFVDDTMRRAQRITANANYRQLSHLIANLSAHGAININDTELDLNIIRGIYIGQNWDGIVLFRDTLREENPRPTSRK